MLKPQRGHLIVNSGPHIKAGSHSFNFSFRLPPNLPTSFDAKHSDGYIRYSIKVCMMANESIKHSRKAYFSVVKQEDLNLMSPMLREPMFEQTSKLCKNGLFGQPSRDCPIRLSATMEKRGYVPGEPIYVQVEVENRAKKSMKTFKMHLMQHVLCHVDQPEVEVRRASCGLRIHQDYPACPFLDQTYHSTNRYCEQSGQASSRRQDRLACWPTLYSGGRSYFLCGEFHGSEIYRPGGSLSRSRLSEIAPRAAYRHRHRTIARRKREIGGGFVWKRGCISPTAATAIVRYHCWHS